MVKTLQGLHPKDADAQWIQCDGCDDKWCSVHHLHVFECPCPGIEDCLFPEGDSKGFNPYGEFDPSLKIKYIVWVGGVDDQFDTREAADAAAQEWRDKGYDDVQVTIE